MKPALALLASVAALLALRTYGLPAANAPSAAPAPAGAPPEKPAVDPEWPTFRGGIERRGNLDGLRGPRAPALRWAYEGPDLKDAMIDSSPAVAGGRIVFSAACLSAFRSSGVILCLDEGGKLAWKHATEKPIFSSHAISGGRVYVGEGFHEDADCKLRALNLSDGKLRWSFTVKSHLESSPAVAGGRVFFGAGDDGVYAISAEDGKLVWRFPDAHVDCPPAVANDRVFAGAGYGKTRIFCLEAATGKPVWSVDTDLPILGAPSIAGSRVYAGFGNGDYVKSGPTPKGAVLCLEADSGKQAWRTDLPDSVLSAIAIDGAEGYFGCRDGFVYAIDLEKGKILRKMPCGGPVLSSPTIVKGQLFSIAAGKARLFAAATGERLWECDLSDLVGKPAGELLSSPAVANGRLYFGTGNAAFLSIGNEAGK